MLVAPAVAAPAPTTWQVSPTSKTITYGQGVTLNGTLMSGGVAVGGLWVDFAQATTQSGSYEVLYKVTTSAGAYSTGTYSVAVMPLQTMYYRFQWAGDATYAASNSDVIPVQVKPSLGKPSRSRRRSSGQEVHGQGHRQAGRGRRAGREDQGLPRRTARGSTFTTRPTTPRSPGREYKASIKISKTGKYKFKATTAASAQFAANETAEQLLTVKK